MKQRAHRLTSSWIFTVLITMASRWAHAESAPRDATLPVPVTGNICSDNNECLAGESCVAGRCSACGTPALTCTTTAECGPACLQVECVEGRCVRAGSPRGDRDGGASDGSFDGAALRIAPGRSPEGEGCGGATVAPRSSSDDRAWAMGFSSLAVVLVAAVRRRRARA